MSGDGIKTAIIKAAEAYEASTPARALVQAIPTLGGVIDVVLSNPVSNLRARRIADLIEKLEGQLKQIGERGPIKPTEDWIEFLTTAMEQAARARTETKRSRLASVITRQVTDPRPWDEADEAARLVADLSDLHISVLSATATARVCDGPFANLRLVTLVEPIKDKHRTVVAEKLEDIFPDYSHMALRMTCAELVARGLLHDEGIGRMDIHAMEYFVITDLGKWLLAWLGDGTQPR